MSDIHTYTTVAVKVFIGNAIHAVEKKIVMHTFSLIGRLYEVAFRLL